MLWLQLVLAPILLLLRGQGSQPGGAGGAPAADTAQDTPPAPSEPARRRRFRRFGARDPSRPQPPRGWQAFVLFAALLPVIGTLALIVGVQLSVGATPGWLPPTLANVDNLARFALLLGLICWVVFLLWQVPRWQAAAWRGDREVDPRALFDLENDSRATLGQILGGLAVLSGLFFAWQQFGQTSENLRVSQEGQITDRFSRAVDQLGSADETIQLGGIYSLERIARDSPRDYGPTMEVLASFARGKSALRPDATPVPASVAVDVPASVEAVLKVIGRRTREQIAYETGEGLGCIDLSHLELAGIQLSGYNLANTCWNGADLQQAQLKGTNFSRADLTDANLSAADLDSAILTDAALSPANLTGATLSNADLTNARLSSVDLSGLLMIQTNLTGAHLDGANLTGAIMPGATLAKADLLSANLTGTVLLGADLATAVHLSRKQIDAAQTDETTKLPPGLAATPAGGSSTPTG